MAKYQAEAKYIASIYPSYLETIRQYHGSDQDIRSSRCTVYGMPQVLRGVEPTLAEEREGVSKRDLENLAPVKKAKIAGKWCVIMEIGDAFENVPDVQHIGEMQGGGRNSFLARPVACEHIAENLMTTWSRSIPGLPTGAAPGLMVIAGTVPKQNEMEQMLAMQTAFYEFRLSEGDRLFLEKNIKGITQQMKDAALWLAKERTWSGSYGTVSTMDCPFCFEQVHIRARRCPHCQGDIAMANLEVLTAPSKSVLQPTA